ncbi:MAG: P63C domain-containing protein [Planctomycetes bacterium]|nr:P63C domain-containing protein [Planctomycetota bacterium]
MENADRQDRAAKGGKSRAAAMTAKERSEAARLAAEGRWGGAIPRATHTGDLEIAGRLIACAVLETRKRVLTQETFLTAIGRAAKAKGGTGSKLMVDGLPPFLAPANLKPFISEELRQSTTPVVFRNLNGNRAFGYDAMLLPMVCEVYLEARDNEALTKSQHHIASACELLMRGLARVGIIALVDEATGYERDKTSDELAKILEAYISAELLPWTRKFPPEFFELVYKLYGWKYKRGSAKRPQCVGHFINKYIYKQLPDGVLPKLRELNPPNEKGRRPHKLFQHLTVDTGNVHLDKQIISTMTIMRISDSKSEFDDLFAKASKKEYQRRLPLVVEVGDEK